MEVVQNLGAVAKGMLEEYAPDMFHRLTAEHMAVEATTTNMVITLAYLVGIIAYGLFFVLLNGGYNFVYSYYWCKTSYNIDKCVK